MSKGIHTCSFFCNRPDCIEAQRDALRDGMEDLIAAERADEREACAKLCDDRSKSTFLLRHPAYEEAEMCAEAIRARGRSERG